MALGDLVTGANLGPEFIQDAVLEEIRLNLGSGISSDPATGVISVDLSGVSLVVTKLPMYEYRDVWAEESGAINAGSAEWSFGNGATGFMGLPVDAGWEIVALGFHADTYAATATVQVDAVSYNTPSNAAANTLASISLSSATDGQGDTNNAHKFENLAAPVPVPPGVVGFITRTAAGNISDARVYARLRRQVGDYVSDVSVA